MSEPLYLAIREIQRLLDELARRDGQIADIRALCDTNRLGGVCCRNDSAIPLVNRIIDVLDGGTS